MNVATAVEVVATLVAERQKASPRDQFDQKRKTVWSIFRAIVITEAGTTTTKRNTTSEASLRVDIGGRMNPIKLMTLVVCVAPALAIMAAQTVGPARAFPAADPLPTWRDGAAKHSIVEFVTKVAKDGGPDFVPPGERIAVFDNDGTLWAEQPLYFQFIFALDRVKALAPQHPEWKEKEPFASLLKGDVKAALAGGEPAIFQIVMATHTGMTTEEFERIVSEWLATAKHPKTKRLYTEMTYQPMLEVLAYLRANGFKTFIVSGGGVEFMRVFVEKVYGIPPEQVVGSSGKLRFDLRDGKPALMKLPELNFFDDKAGKPIAIQTYIGHRTIAAFGNSDGDLQMLQWTCTGPGRRLCLYVRHTDSEREWAYDRQSSIGRLDKGLDEAKAKGWTVVSMKDDWKRVRVREGVKRSQYQKGGSSLCTDQYCNATSPGPEARANAKRFAQRRRQS